MGKEMESVHSWKVGLHVASCYDELPNVQDELPSVMGGKAGLWKQAQEGREMNASFFSVK